MTNKWRESTRSNEDQQWHHEMIQCKKNVLQFGIIIIGDGKIYFCWFDFLNPTVLHLTKRNTFTPQIFFRVCAPLRVLSGFLRPCRRNAKTTGVSGRTNFSFIRWHLFLCPWLWTSTVKQNLVESLEILVQTNWIVSKQNIFVCITKILLLNRPKMGPIVQ